MVGDFDDVDEDADVDDDLDPETDADTDVDRASGRDSHASMLSGSISSQTNWPRFAVCLLVANMWSRDTCCSRAIAAHIVARRDTM